MKNFFKQFLVWLAHALIGVVFFVLLIVAVSEWAAGCGESYVDAKGKTHVGQCIFISKLKG